MSGLVPFAFSGEEANGLVYSADPSLSHNRKREFPTSESFEEETIRRSQWTDGQEPDSDIWRIASSPPHAFGVLSSDIDGESTSGLKKQKIDYSMDDPDAGFGTQQSTATDYSQANTTLTQVDFADYLEQPRRDAYQNALKIIHSAIVDGNPVVSLADIALRRIPEEIGDLKDLIAISSGFEQSWIPNIQLFFTNNLISRLPRQLFDVTALTVLSLRNNQLTSIPPAIGRLKNLQDLSIGGNELKYLPSEILNLDKLQILAAHPNPYLSPPGEMDSQEHTPPPTQPSNLTRTQYAASLNTYHAMADHVGGGAPSLSEHCLRIISNAIVTSGDRERWNLDQRIDELVDLAIDCNHRGLSCGICNRQMVLGVGYALEWWDGVVGNREVVFQRNLCSFNCVEKWKQNNDCYEKILIKDLI